MDKPHSRYIVTKANDLIMAKYDLSLAEQRLIIEVASMVHPKKDEDFKGYDVSVRDYVNLVDSTAKNEYQRMKELAEKLLKKPLFIKNDDGGWTGLNWFSSLRYIPGNGVLRCKFSPDLKPYLLKLNECYTSYQLENVLRLKSKYAVRLYEALKSRTKLRKRMWEVELNELRVMIAIPKSYTWKDIRRQILQVAKKSLKATDIQFEFEPIKRGRRVVAVQFKIHDTHQQALELGQPTDTPAEKLKSAPIDNQAYLIALVPEQYRIKAVKLIQKYKEKGDEYIKRSVKYTNKNAKTNYIGYLVKVLADDLGYDWWREQQKTQKSKLKVVAEEQKRKLENTKMEKQARMKKRFFALSPEDQHEYIEAATTENPEINIFTVIKQIAADMWIEDQN
ncbi:MAG: replication initiation protein [Desulfobacteraceae bacterium]|nr:replication initiation protein [Desulfobacteraceae bacterium]